MIRSLLLGAALLSITSATNASQGTIRFVGRIVDSGCNIGLVRDQQQLNLDTCPMSALGAQLQVSILATGDVITLAAYHKQVGLAAHVNESQQRFFSKSYALQARPDQPEKTGYLVVVTYP